jgi:Arc/MetJ-type ribon-helix-helix transcriptional regulator
MKKSKLEVSLPENLVEYVQAEVQSGHYSSASDVVSESLRKLQASANGNGQTPGGFDRSKVAQALAELRQLSDSQTLGDDLTLRELIDEGRA